MGFTKPKASALLILTRWWRQLPTKLECATRLPTAPPTFYPPPLPSHRLRLPPHQVYSIQLVTSRGVAVYLAYVMHVDFQSFLDQTEASIAARDIGVAISGLDCRKSQSCEAQGSFLGGSIQAGTSHNASDDSCQRCCQRCWGGNQWPRLPQVPVV